MYSFVEHIVFTQYKENDEGHVDVMRVLVLCMVENLQKRHHLQKIQKIQGRGYENSWYEKSIQIEFTIF